MFNQRIIFLIILITLSLVQFNSAEGPKDPIKCYECNSSDEVKCTQKLTGDTFSTSCKEEKIDSCYVGIDGDGKTVRRCASENDKKDCTNNEKCKVTPGEKSNSEIFPENRTKCIKCEGIDNCAKIVDDNLSNLCEKNDDKCCFGTDNVSKVFRGCMAENTKKLPCTECSNDECKTEIKTIKCIQCAAGDKCKRPDKLENECKIEAKDTERLCIQNKEKPSCFIRTNSSNEVTRGCASELVEDKNTEDILCEGENCNNKCISDINCAQCGGKNQPECIQDKEAEWYKEKCPNYNVVCRTCKSGDKTVRGCGADSDQQSQCQYSFKNETFSNFKCYRCRSDSPSQEFCSNDNVDSSQLQPQKCVNDPKNDDEKKCYIDNYDGVVIRGCVSDIVQNTVKRRCNKDSKLNMCSICNEDSCNNGKVPNSAAISLLVSFNSIAILSIILYLL